MVRRFTNNPRKCAHPGVGANRVRSKMHNSENKTKRKTNTGGTMKFNKWTIGLAAVGVVSLASAAKADEKASPISVQTALSSTTLSGSIDTAVHWNIGN